APSPSVTADLTFSIRTSLDASTVTPGIAAPDESLTTPTIALCAYAALDRKIAATNANNVRVGLRAMLFPSNATCPRRLPGRRVQKSDLGRAIGGYASCADVSIQRTAIKDLSVHWVQQAK